MNLLDLVKDQITGTLAKEASGFLGESESGVAKALGGIMPTLMGGAIEKATKPDGAAGLMDMIGGLDLNKLGDIGGLFGGGADSVNGLMNNGGGLLEGLLGNKTSGIVDLIAGMAGLKSSSASSLLKMAAPLLMGLIGKQVAGKGLGGLVDLLMGQKQHVANAMPAGVGNLLGLSSFGNLSSTSANIPGTSSVSNGGGDNDGGGMGWLKWALPLLALAGLAWWWTKNNSKKVEETIQKVDSLAIKTDTMASKVLTAAEAFAKEMGVTLTGATTDGIENQLIGFIKDNAALVNDTIWFNFDRLLFDTGKSTLKEGSQEQITNMAAILKAFPKVKLKIGGYTDNQGNPKANLKLSGERANTVMAALVKLGTDASRLKAEGYGDQHPVGDNKTEEGRQQNRRIAVRVTEK